jgi:murein DD-endopeptidase MepM/ murein hydrolase activator NlpD
LDDAVVKRIEREKQRFDNLWAADPGPRHWNGPFMPPLPLEVTSPFGFRRIVNGVARSPHGGVDLKAREGTEVKAANDGVVALLDEFFFTGRTLVLNHGAGLYTMYFHLADFLVKEAAFVRKGEVIGLAGMTGRVTGPHLHWGVRLNGARVDPLALPGIESGAR